MFLLKIPGGLYSRSCFILACLLVFIASPGYAQHPMQGGTLKGVHVKGKHNKTNNLKLNGYAPGQKITTIDSALLLQYQQQNMATLLAQQTPVFIKSYGFNSLATLNFRGSSAAQSQVLWNGVPLHNAASGITDVSLLPVSLFDQVSLVYGSSAALSGSGNVGGALLLENEPPHFDSSRQWQLSIAGGAGSYGQYQGGLKALYRMKRWDISMHTFGQTAQNNFKYTAQNGQEQQTQNAALAGGGLQLRCAYRIGAAQTIAATLWVQQYKRAIPPALFEPLMPQNTQEADTRFLVDWKKEKVRAVWYVKTAFLHDRFIYENAAIAQHSDHVTEQLFVESGWEYHLNAQQKLLLFFPVGIAWTYLPDSQGTGLHTLPAQFKTALAGAYSLDMLQHKIKIALNVRAEAMAPYPIFLPGINANLRLADWLDIRGNIQRTFRAPTLHELYYNPGGNTHLLPEKGWAMDLGYRLHTNPAKRFVWLQDAAAYNRTIENWIIWFGGAIWTPHNIARVWSRGLETENKLLLHIGKWTGHISINTAYTLATTQESYVPKDGSIGKQIPYTPRYQYQGNVGFSYAAFRLNYNHTYTGYRFVTVDESQHLSPYHTGNVQMMYNGYLLKHRTELTFQINNLWQEHYQVVAGRPMPGRNCQTGFRLYVF
jgi:iron complex outermembrane receptor protein